LSQFAGKTILVTGTSRGLGAAIADALETQGAHVVRHTRALGDLSTPAGIAAVAGQVPKLDILVHNAGVNPAPHETIDELSPETLRAVFAVNVEAPIFLTKALLDPLRAARGQVLAVSSEAGMFSNGMGPTGLSYRLSKAALNAFVLVASQALAADGVRVNAVHPGWVRTDMGGDAAPLSPEDAARDVVAVLMRVDEPTGRIFQAGVEADW
jgi:NAD(P)-dependent dehydrogenase (short-subunit alcohol dehydrogenase family)